MNNEIICGNCGKRFRYSNQGISIELNISCKYSKRCNTNTEEKKVLCEVCSIKFNGMFKNFLSWRSNEN